jgi:hypothetical protein
MAESHPRILVDSVPVPDAVRERIMACTDVDQLDTWLRRAVNATTANEVIRD